MHIQIVRFDRVFDMHKGSYRTTYFTRFGFELDGKSNKWGYVHLHADLAAGRKLALAMQKPNLWGHIYGVADCESGKLYVEAGALGSIVGGILIGLAAQIALVPLVFLKWPELSAGSRCVVTAGIVMLALYTYTNALENYRLLLAARALKHFAATAKSKPGLH